MNPWVWLHHCNAYRVHVVAVFLVLAYLFSLPFLPATEPRTFSALLVVFGCLWGAFYIGNKYFDFAEDMISQPTEARRSAFVRNLTLTLYLIPLPLLWWFELPLLPYLALAVATLGYSVRPPGLQTRVKSILLLKNVYAAGLWWLAITTLLVFYLPTGERSVAELAGMTLDVFLILLVIELLWDIRDVDGDRAVGTTTVPVWLGVPATKAVIGCFLLSLWWYNDWMVANPFFVLNLIYLALVTVFVQTQFTATYFHAIVYTEIFLLWCQAVVLRTWW